MSDRVIVFIDYENLRFSALSCFHPVDATRTDGNVDPFALAQLLVRRRNRDSQLSQVRVYRGRPSPLKQPSAAAANDAQAGAWARRPSVEVIRRNLRYPPNYPFAPAQEKGVDLALGVDFVSLAWQGAYDAGIIVSRDTDLLPALEEVSAHDLARVEVMAWQRSTRISFAGGQLPWCHRLTRDDYESIRDQTDYLKGGA